MTTLMLAVRNLLRNRRRSLATLLAMAIGSAAILLFGGYKADIMYGMQTSYVRDFGHLQIQHRDFYLYGSGDPTLYGISDYQKVLDAVRADPALAGLLEVVTPKLEFGGIAGNFTAGVSRTVIGLGVVPNDFNRMQQWNEYDAPLPLRPFALTGTVGDSAVVGTGLARVLQMCGVLKVANCPQRQVPQRVSGEALPDDVAELSRLEAPPAASTPAASERRIELLASNSSGTPNVASLEVVRAEVQGFKELDDIYLGMHLAQAQRLVYGKDAPRATAIMLQLRQSEKMPVVQSRLAALLPELKMAQPLAVLDFGQLNPFYSQSMKLFDTIFGFIFILIGGIVLFTVSNTMNTSVVERTVEIGTLRAIGLRRAGIRRLFLVEGLLLGFSGALLGVVCALLAAFVFNRSGLTWVPPSASEAVPLALRVWGQWIMIVATTLGLIAVATASAWWPARRAAGMVVVDALRHV